MNRSPTTGLPILSEQEATGATADIYNEVKRITQLPVLPNIFMALGNSDSALNMYWLLWRSVLEYTTLPQALVSMIQYTVAENNNCVYCSAGHEMTCRTLGIDEETLDKLVRELDSVNPERVRAIIEFAIKVAGHAQELESEDYEALRRQGVTDEEIAEIILIAAIQTAGDIVADATKVEVESLIIEALGR